MILLTPLQQAAFEIGFLVGYPVEVDILAQDAVPDKPLAVFVASVEIHRTDKRLKGIARHIAVVRASHKVAAYQVSQAHLVGQMTECLALDNLAPHTGKKTFSFALEVVIKDIAHHGIQYGVAQILQTLVVGKPAFSLLHRHALVCQGLAVEVYLPRIETQDTVKRTIKLPVTSERQPYRIYYVSCFHRYVSVKPGERHPPVVDSLFYVLLEDDTGIVSAEAESVAQGGTNLALLGLAEGEVQAVVYLGILVALLVIDGGRNDVFLD